jgi:hypothetical protein
MVLVLFKVVPTAISTLLPAFLQVLEAAGECLFGMAMSSIVAALIFSCRHHFSSLSVVGTEKKIPSYSPTFLGVIFFLFA